MKTSTVVVLAAVGAGAAWWWWSQQQKAQAPAAQAPGVRPAGTPNLPWINALPLFPLHIPTGYSYGYK
jgi:hypothetical protein